MPFTNMYPVSRSVAKLKNLPLYKTIQPHSSIVQDHIDHIQTSLAEQLDQNVSYALRGMYGIF